MSQYPSDPPVIMLQLKVNQDTHQSEYLSELTLKKANDSPKEGMNVRTDVQTLQWMYKHTERLRDTQTSKQTDGQIDRHSPIHLTAQESKNLRLHLTHTCRSFVYLRANCPKGTGKCVR